MKFRKLPLAAGASVLAVVLAACGGSSTTTASSATSAASAAVSSAASAMESAVESASSEVAEVTSEEAGAPTVDPNAGLVIWADATKAPAVEAAAKKFGDENGITVVVQVVAKDLQTNFVTASQAGQGPDIVLGAHDWIGNLVQNGAIDPIQMDEATAGKFNEVAVQAVTFNGQIYGVPYAVENIFLVRNTDMAPDAPTTVEEMVAKGKELVAAGTATEIMAVPVGQNGDAYHMYPFFSSGGGYLFGETPQGYDVKDLGLASPGGIEAMTKISNLAKEGALKTSISGDNLLGFFTDKKTAFMVTGPWNIANLQKSGVPFDISPIPPFEGGEAARPFVGVQALFVAAKGAHKTAAEEFASNYFATDEVAAALYEVDPRPSALITAFEKEAASDPLVAKQVEAAKDGYAMPANPEMAGVWDPFGKAIGAVVGGADPASTIEAAAATIEATIK